MVTNEFNEDLVYPYRQNEMMQTKIYYEQVMLKHNSDWSGFTKLTSTEPKKRFYLIKTTDKTYYPSTSDNFK